MSKKYSAIIYTQDGDEAARFSELTAPELMRKIDAAIEVGSFAVVDAAGAKIPEEASRGVGDLFDQEGGDCFIIDSRGIL